MLKPIREIIPRPPWSNVERDAQTLIYELQWCQDEIRNLEADIRELHTKLYDKEQELEELQEEIEELRKK